MNLKQKFKRNKGITLIALIVTIIVLLILAGISISMLTGQNGILNRASEAKDKNGTAQNGDLVKLSAMDALSQGLGIITDANLKTALNNNIGEGKYEITGDATNGWTVTVDGEDYRVESTGIVNVNGSSTGSVNWDKILEDANKNPESMKHEDQVKSSLIGIGTDGKPVNMDLWNPTYYEGNKTWGLTGNDNYYNTTDVYVGDITEDGKIIGKIPQYIWNSETNEFEPVTSMLVTFYGYENLIESPEIPSTVNDMNGTFYGCTKLKVASKIPNGVTSMYRAFAKCTSLEETPDIPNSVNYLKYTFADCTNLKKALKIGGNNVDMGSTFSNCVNLVSVQDMPDSASDMLETFLDCKNLKSIPKIPSGLTRLERTFNGCNSLTKVPKIPESVTSMRSTFAGCTSLITAPEIPNSVTFMSSTFERCTSLITAPKIPNSVTSMGGTFAGCTNLTNAPTIPENVEYIGGTFYECTNLTGEICINAKVKDSDYYVQCFEKTVKPIQLTGTCSVLSDIAATSSNGNVTVK